MFYVRPKVVIFLPYNFKWKQATKKLFVVDLRYCFLWQKKYWKRHFHVSCKEAESQFVCTFRQCQSRTSIHLINTKPHTHTKNTFLVFLLQVSEPHKVGKAWPPSKTWCQSFNRKTNQSTTQTLSTDRQKEVLGAQETTANNFQWSVLCHLILVEWQAGGRDRQTDRQTSYTGFMFMYMALLPPPNMAETTNKQP